MCLAFVALVGVIERSIGARPLPFGQVLRVAAILLGVYKELSPAQCIACAGDFLLRWRDFCSIIVLSRTFAK